ncbi:sorbosone dehydrogenase [Pseudomonas oryzihabitans]|nr:sorbosone dehydrogenase [Pseudomonas psychrotolerans]
MRTLALTLAAVTLLGCGETARLQREAGYGPTPTLPEPHKTLLPTINVAPAVGWPEGGKPTAAPGSQVQAFARGLDHPRWLYVLPNGDVLVAESNAPKREDFPGIKNWIAGLFMKKAGAGVPSADRITLLRDADGDGVAETRSVFAEHLHSPFGMVLVGEDFYVANADALVRLSYRPGATRLEGQPVTVTELPAGINHHWTKNVIASRDGKKLYLTVGSNSNVGENGLDIEEGRAAIWELDRASGQKRLFATGLRNPNGLDWEPTTGKLWTVVNERDEIGSDLVPDYATSVQDGGFYGWPYSYWGKTVDSRVQPPRPDLVAKALTPDYALGTHTASLGLAFASADSGLPTAFRQGMFVGQHGSWNRDPKSGYKVVFVPFQNGKPSGPPRDLLTGFLNGKEEAQGRPVGVVNDGHGGLLVADDVGNTIWRVSAQRP